MQVLSFGTLNCFRMGRIDIGKAVPVQGVTLPYVSVPTLGPEFITAQYVGSATAPVPTGELAWSGFAWVPQRAIFIRRMSLQCFFINTATGGQEAIDGRIDMTTAAGIQLNTPLPYTSGLIPGNAPINQLSFAASRGESVTDFPDGIIIPILPGPAGIAVTCRAYRDAFAVNDQAGFYFQVQYKQL